MGNTALGFGTAGEALGAITSGMGFLAKLDAAMLSAQVKADTLKGLERADSLELIARSRLIRSFDANGEYEADGCQTVGTWLAHETGITADQATEHRKWTKTVLEHPAIAGLVADGLLTGSWLGRIAKVTCKVREDVRREGEAVIAAMARETGLGPKDLLRLAHELREQAPAEDPRDDDPDAQFRDRSLSLDLTMGGGVLRGLLSEECAAALQAMLRRLAVRCGSLDDRSIWQRQHDALQEMCLRLLGSDLSAPTPGGAAAHMMVTTDLGMLIGLDDGSVGMRAWIENTAQWYAAQRATNADTHGGDGSLWVTGPAAQGLACDAALFPVVVGHVDTRYIDQLISQCVKIDQVLHGEPAVFTPDRGAHQARIAEMMREILGTCAQLLGGEPGLAAHLRRSLLGHMRLGGVSLPLDVGDRDDIPWQVRRAVLLRDGGKCQWPGGCDRPGYSAHPHHLNPRATHGPTSLTNLLTLCYFHHQVAVHRWGWRLTLHGDGSVTGIAPDGTVIRGPARPPPPRPG